METVGHRLLDRVQLVVRQVGYEQRSFWRNRGGAFFTFAFPVLLLLIFGSLNRNTHVTDLGPGHLVFTQYFVPSMLSFGVMSACFVNIGTVLSVRRQTGQLKRVRGTPLSRAVFLAGVIGNALVLSAILTVIVIGIGSLVFGGAEPHHWAAMFLALTVGTAAFCAMGIAATGITTDNSVEAAGTVLNAVFFPAIFISGAFFPVSNSSTLGKIAAVLPIKHLITATFAAFDPRVHNAGIRGWDLLIVTIWGMVGGLAALRWFRWLPVRK